MEERKRIAIACQGGGSQTAFTAGVLKKWLEKGLHEKYHVVGLSGTSGGAICALLAWYGLLKAAKGSTEPSYKALVDFWQDNSANTPWEKTLNDALIEFRRMIERGKISSAQFSPYDWQWQSNLNFLRSQTHRQEFFDLKKMLEKHVKFSELENLLEPSSPRLLMGAVDILSGKCKAFDSWRGEISIDAVLASAAVPTLFEAVEIDGKFYWDGLFAENPPVTKLEKTHPHEIWIIKINPLTRKSVPTTPETIIDRRNELAGNIMLAAELRIYEIYNVYQERGGFKQEFLAEFGISPTKLRMLHMSEELEDSLDYASKLDRNPSFIDKLLADGESQAQRFWQNPDDEQYEIPLGWHTDREQALVPELKEEKI